MSRSVSFLTPILLLPLLNAAAPFGIRTPPKLPTPRATRKLTWSVNDFRTLLEKRFSARNAQARR
jgi:hypothetical protein